MNREKISTNTAKTEEGDEFKVHYYLLQEETENGIEYGVLVTMEEEKRDEISQEVRCLTPVKEKAIAFIKEISEGVVTPTTLYEIVDEFLAVIWKIIKC